MKARITQERKSPTQSGFGKSQWVITLVEDVNTRFVNNITGWTGSADTNQQLNLKFSSKEDAILYANEQNYDIALDEAKVASVKEKSYASNFPTKVIN